MSIQIPKKLLQQEYIARLTLWSDPMYIRPAQEFVVYFAKLFGFTDPDLLKLELATEEAVLNTIENSFDENELGSFDIRVVYRPGVFVITIDDQGIPTDTTLLEKKENAALGLLLMRNLADEFNIINLGRAGKRTELVKYLPETSISEILKSDEPQAQPTGEDVPLSAPVIRLIHPDDAPDLSRLAYRVYGYTYASVFYYPEKIRELIENGLLQSAVSVNENGEIVGNLSLFFEHNGAPVADSGAAMVDPRYRGHSLFKEMKKFLKAHAIATGMYGLYSEAVTIHSFTQQGNLSLGAKETGVMLAYASENVTFKKINNDKLSEQRQAVALFYLKTNNEPHRTVYLNEKFYPVLKKIYDHLDLDREIHLVPDQVTPLAPLPLSEISTTVKPDLNIAVIGVVNIGQDAFNLIYRQLRELCIKKIETIYVEIPMDKPEAAVLCRDLNKAGFMLSGIVPELRNGDVLKMQYLNNVYVDPSKIVIVSELTRELLNEIMKDYR
jgi:anti-sigma regulatory factor (Ser/Thr protein kinase)